LAPDSHWPSPPLAIKIVLKNKNYRMRPLPTAPQTGIFDLVLTDVDGKAQSLQQWRGKILVLNYWATWCFPCREEMPGFSRLQAKYQDKGVQFVGISIDEAPKIIEFQKETPVSYPLLDRRHENHDQ
jgi:thiol-disulfide isomerase/thioredoxin